MNDKILIYLQGYSTHKKNKVDIVTWLNIAEEVKYSKEYAALMKRTF